MPSARSLSAGLGAIAVIVAGCATDHHTTTASPTFSLPVVAMRYPEGTPARAAADLLLAIEYNDPGAAATYLVPAWKLTAGKLTGEVSHGSLSAIGAVVGADPHVTSEVIHGRQALVEVTALTPRPAVLRLERIGDSWKFRSARVGSLSIAPPSSGGPSVAAR